MMHQDEEQLGGEHRLDLGQVPDPQREVLEDRRADHDPEAQPPHRAAMAASSSRRPLDCSSLKALISRSWKAAPSAAVNAAQSARR